MKKLTTTIAATAMAVCMLAPISAFASEINTTGGQGTVPVTMTAPEATFSVTVPTSLPVTFDAKGVATYATDAAITNLSHGPVKVSGVAINPQGGWALADFSTDMSAEKVGTKKLGMQLGVRGTTLGQTGADGSYAFDAGQWASIKGLTPGAEASSAAKQTLDYKTVSPAQVAGLNNETVANVVFTIGWDAVG